MKHNYKDRGKIGYQERRVFVKKNMQSEAHIGKLCNEIGYQETRVCLKKDM